MDIPPSEHLRETLAAYAQVAKPPLHSCIVMHRGVVAAEFYGLGYTAASYQPVFSVTKSVVSILVGRALGDGQLALRDTLAQWFPERTLPAATGAITIEHLLTMTGGFAPLKRRLTSADPLGELLARPLAHAPGTDFHYDNETVDLLVAIVERAVGMSPLEYAHTRLFAPLGIWHRVPKSGRRRLWKTDRQGRVKGGYGLHLTVSEMVALGQLYLQRGRWGDDVLVPEAYVSASTSAQAGGGHPEFVRYGYLWWTASDASGHSAFFAGGRGGQYIYVVPALELVVACTSTAQNADGRRHRVMLARAAVEYAQAQMQP